MTSIDVPESTQVRADIEAAWAGDLPKEKARPAVEAAIELLDKGTIRVAEKTTGAWRVHAWVKQAILLYFRYMDNAVVRAGESVEWFDKVPLKRDFAGTGVRVVPPAFVRRGAFVEPNVVLMPSYVNIGARVGTGTMIDTWSTVGSCAQIGANCHISGGVGIGGVLEPLQAAPVIVEDGVFIGARSEVAEGVIVEEGAVLAMGCYVGASTKIFDARTRKLLEPGRIPPRAVCVPGALPSKDGSHQTYAIIVKKERDERTDARTALNDILREERGAGG